MQSSHHVSPYSKQNEAMATSANKLQPTPAAESKKFIHPWLDDKSCVYLYMVDTHPHRVPSHCMVFEGVYVSNSGLLWPGILLSSLAVFSIFLYKVNQKVTESTAS